MNNNKLAVGYLRVSSKKQIQDSEALEVQREKLFQAAREQGFLLRGMFSEVASATPDDQLSNRPEFLKAVEEARRLGAVLMVTAPTRLFRNRRVAKKFFKQNRFEVFSADCGKVLSKAALLREIEKGSKDAVSISLGTTNALANGARAVPVNSREHGLAGKKASQATQTAKKNALNEAIIRIVVSGKATPWLSSDAVPG